MNPKPSSNNLHARLLGFATVMLWASGFVFTGVGVQHFSPFPLGFLRYGTAALALIGVGMVKRVGLPAPKDIPLFILLGALGFALYTLAFNHAMTTISAATASIVTATVPIMTAVASSLMFAERLRRAQWIAVGIEFGGIVLLNLDGGNFSMESGLLWMLCAAISFAAYNITLRKTARRYSALQSTIYSIVAGALLLLPFAPQALKELSAAPLQAVAVVLHLGLVPSAIGFILWSKACAITTRLSDVTNFMFVTPLLSTSLDFVVTGSVPSMGTIVGGIVVLAGLVLFNRYRNGFALKGSSV